MAHDAFISHAKEDNQVANAMVASLEQRRIRCWIAPRDVLPGKNYAEAIAEALDESQILVLILSKYANASPHVEREVERAASKRLVILTFRLDTEPLSRHIEYFISARHWLDAITPPLELHLALLGDAIEALLGLTKDIPRAKRAGVPESLAAPSVPAPQENRALSVWQRSAPIAIGGGMIALALIAYLLKAPAPNMGTKQVELPAVVGSPQVAQAPEAPTLPLVEPKPRRRERVSDASTAGRTATPTGRDSGRGETLPDSPNYRQPQRWQEYAGFSDLVGRWRGTDRDGLVIEMMVPPTEAENVIGTVTIPRMNCSMSLKLVRASEMFTTSEFFWKPTTIAPGCPELESLYTNPVMNSMTWRLTLPNGKQLQIVMDRRI